MRPPLLFPLFAQASALQGIGPRFLGLFARLCGEKVVDVLFHLPVGLIDRRYAPTLLTAESGKTATLTLKILSHEPPQRPGKPYRLHATDGTDELTIAYFNVKGDYLTRLYPTDRPVVVSGFLEKSYGAWRMNHPDYVLPPARQSEIPPLEPVYPMTEGLGGKTIRRAVAGALARLPDLPEWQDGPLLAREKWPSFKAALEAAHAPQGEADLAPSSPARRRLAYDELLADQLALAVIRRHHKNAGGKATKATGALTQKLREALPFRLTGGQDKALAEIAADMEAPRRMLRLLQGDVGSGKTILALFAMLHALEAGKQAALMAPTEILAKQHFARLSGFLEPLGLPLGLLVGKGRGKGRAETLAALKDGTLGLVVGTHALFQDDVAFADLGLAVMDEQHRFGVEQRLKLADKGDGVDLLVMTATPIPRTLSLTAYGDMDVSRLMEKPAGRLPIDTRLIDAARIDEVIEGARRQIAKGAQVYWVCPLVEESEKIDLAAATQRAELLAERLGADKVGLVHGRLKPEAKDKVMAAFAGGETSLLVATTVIEVGVDVPAATLMIVEHAERFGLAQLHQLRGRIGRGQDKATCLLLYQAPLGEIAKTRLTMMRETEDGFRLAEEDLRLRGPGEVLGTRQSGAPLYRLADLATCGDLIDWAHSEAALILARDAALTSPRGEALKNLLYLFEKDGAVPLFRAG